MVNIYKDILKVKDAKAVQISVAAKDDYAITRASLHMTLARGSGENIRFSDKEVEEQIAKQLRTLQNGSGQSPRKIIDLTSSSS